MNEYTKYEYGISHLSGSYEVDYKILNGLGADGWNVFQITDNIAYYKRRCIMTTPKESEIMRSICVDHMESKDDETKTKCGLVVNHVKGYVMEYGAIEAYCQRCRSLYKKDIEKLNAQGE